MTKEMELDQQHAVLEVEQPCQSLATFELWNQKSGKLKSNLMLNLRNSPRHSSVCTFSAVVFQFTLRRSSISDVMTWLKLDHKKFMKKTPQLIMFGLSCC